MTPLVLIVCVFGTCFNPGQITYMETQHISSDCKINFSGTNPLTIDDHDCEAVAAEINKQLLEKTGNK